MSGLKALKFFVEFVNKPDVVGAFLPSGVHLAEAMVDSARVAHSEMIVELGPGSGAITGSILRKLAPTATFFAMEINGEFVSIMKQRFPHVVVHHDSAANTQRYLEALGKKGCDSIVSGLPWAIFDEPLQDELLDAVWDVLLPGGTFSTYMYATSRLLPAGRRFCAKQCS